jgi:pseudouridine synthase
MKEKLQKIIAESGFCSRRKAEELIVEKRVKVNGIVAEIGQRIEHADKILIDNKPLKTERKLIYILLNKPIGYICTNKVEAGEKTVFDLVDIKERLFSVGRLDKNSRGLVLLTNDGDFSYKLTHPSFEHEKEYEIVLGKEIDGDIKKKMKEGVDIKEKTLAKIKSIKRIGERKYIVVLSEGKRRQIRRMFEVFNCTVLDIKRIRINNYLLGDIKEKKWIFTEKK